MSHYNTYYAEQIDGGGIRQFYVGSRYQCGHGGIGSFLRGLCRSVLPYLKSDAKVIGKEAISAGINVLSNVMSGDDFKNAVRTNLRKSRKNFENKAARKITEMMGAGYKRRIVRRKLQSKKRRTGART